jgi:hypothetical protein
VEQEMGELLEAIGQLLLVADVHTNSEDRFPKGNVFEAIPTAISASFEPIQQIFSSLPTDPPAIGNFETHLFNNALNDRQKALDSLLEAANLLNIECKAAVHRNSNSFLEDC